VERAIKIIAVLLGALVSAGIIGASAARSVAVDQVRPVESRVTKLETQREEDSKKIDEVRADVKELLRRVR
jgi:cell division protein FtsL